MFPSAERQQQLTYRGLTRESGYQPLSLNNNELNFVVFQV